MAQELDKIIIPDSETEEQKQARLEKEAEEAKQKAAEEEARKKAEEEEAARKKAEDDAKKTKEGGGDDDEPEVVMIDDVEYTIDENGNAVAKDGTIKYTAEDIAKMSEGDDDSGSDNYFENISKASGIVIKDDEGNIKQYEQTIEGFAQREADVKALGEAEGFNKGFARFMQDNPDIASIIEYKQRYGTIEGYSSTIDYSKVELKDDYDFLADLIYKAEIQKGTSPDRAKRLVEFAKANNTLKDDAAESLNWLRKTQEAEIKQIQAEQEAAYQEELRKEIQFFGATFNEKGEIVNQNVKGSLYDMIVTTGAIGDYSIPKNGLVVKTAKGDKLISREQIYDYFARPVTEINGYYYTQAQVDDMKRMQNPAEIALRYIMNLTGGVDQLVKKSINDEKIRKIRSLKSNTSKTIGSKGGQKSGGKESIVLPVR